MSLKEIYFCDVCSDDGTEKRAVIRYLGDEDVEYHACKKCAKLVKEAGCKIIEKL